MAERDVGNPIRLVQLDPHKVLGLGGVLDVMSLNVSSGTIRGVATYPELSGKTAVSPELKSNVRALALPMKTVALPSPEWK